MVPHSAVATLWAADPVVLSPGDTAWMLASSALVLIMQPGLAFFYGGLTRSKSTLNMMMMSFICITIVSILWVLFGFALAFGTGSSSGLFGDFSWGHMTQGARQIVAFG